MGILEVQQYNKDTQRWRPCYKTTQTLRQFSGSGLFLFFGEGGQLPILYIPRPSKYPYKSCFTPDITSSHFCLAILQGRLKHLDQQPIHRPHAPTQGLATIQWSETFRPPRGDMRQQQQTAQLRRFAALNQLPSEPGFQLRSAVVPRGSRMISGWVVRSSDSDHHPLWSRNFWMISRRFHLDGSPGLGQPGQRSVDVIKSLGP